MSDTEYIPGTLIEVHHEDAPAGNAVAGDAPASSNPAPLTIAQIVALTGGETVSPEQPPLSSLITQTGPSAVESTLDAKIDALDANTKAVVHELLMHIGTGFTDIGLAVGMTRISEFVAKVRG